ncbi:hypothetical protein L9F63_019348, partial [Diploptera punctata]
NLIVVIARFLDSAYYHPNDIIELKQGQLRGHRLTSRKDREIFAFQGIPYAQSPVGNLRFKPPQPPQPWQGILDATKDGSECLQRNFFNPDEDLQGEEDCLYLNVFTPKKPGSARDVLLDVMFWIHGGGWISGSGGSLMYGPQFLLDKDIVLVTINYRLGALGFLSTGDSVCPGNNGLKDQVAALRWVRNNIAAFGGNPNSVTIFGESAGGSSVHYHMLSPLSRGLFHRSISQSGTALLNWAFAPNGSTVHHTRKLASLVGCPTEPSNALLLCLKNRDAKEIASKDKEFMEWDSDPMIPFNVVVETDDEAFLTKTPEESVLASSSEHLVPWMVGLNSADGALDTASKTFHINPSNLNDRFNELVSLMFFIRETTLSPVATNISEQIRKFYFGNHQLSQEISSNLTNMFTDAFIFAGTNQAVKLHSQKKSSSVYYYLFDYRGTHSYSSMFGDFTHDYGVTHQDELLYLFPEDHLFPNATRSQDDDKMVEFLTTLWTNFAHRGYGNPTPKTSGLQTWDRVSSSSTLEYAHIRGDGLHMEKNLFKKRADFWSSLPLHFKSSTTPRQDL